MSDYLLNASLNFIGPVNDLNELQESDSKYNIGDICIIGSTNDLCVKIHDNIWEPISLSTYTDTKNYLASDGCYDYHKTKVHTKTNCPCCGAPITDGEYCEFCGVPYTDYEYI